MNAPFRYSPGRGSIAVDRGNVALRRWWKLLGTAAVTNICERAEVGFPHFRHCAAGRRRLSVDAARRLIEAAGPERAPSIDVLLPPNPKRSTGRKTPAKP